jgi:glycosyltransferase involved in cell wall biosynthesis
LIDSEVDSQSLPRQVVTQLAGLAIRIGERKGLPYEEWMAKRVFARAVHILVHARVLRDRLLAAGIPAERVTFQIFPIPKVQERVGSKVLDEFAQRFAHRRKIVLFGFPHPRKTLEHAIQALPQLPADVMLMFVGGIEGEFRQHYVRSLQEIARGLGVLDRIEFLGEIPEPSLPFAFELAEFALAPFSYATGSASFSYLISEGVPIVASDLPEHETLGPGRCGNRDVQDGRRLRPRSRRQRPAHDQEGRRRLAAQNRAFAERHTYHNLAAMIHDRLAEMM